MTQSSENDHELVPVATEAEVQELAEQLATTLTSLRAACILAPEPLRSLLAERLDNALGALIAFQKTYLDYIKGRFGDIRLAVSYLDFDIHATKSELHSELDRLRKRFE